MHGTGSRRYALIIGVFVVLAACLSLVVGSRPALADPPMVPWSQIEGPAFPVRRNLPPGFYIHRNGNEVVVASHGFKQRGLVFIGRIIVDGGVILKPQPLVLERQHHDAFRQQTPNVLDFRLLTFGHIDGVKFRVKDGQRISFEVRVEGQPTERVFFGPKPVQVVSYPIICDMTR